MRVQERFSTEEADVANASAMQDVERGIELCHVDPTQILAGDLTIGKIAKVASRITGIGDRNVAQGGTALSDEMQRIA
jgi:hypothetical protein